MADFARARHLRLGVIYNANMTPQVTSDQAWIARAEQNVGQIEDGLRIVPDQAIFHSWNKYPRRSITNAAGLGEDRLVEFYLERRSGVQER